MKLLKKTTLYLVKGKQEKVYEIDLCEMGPDKYLVNFRYGKVNAPLSEGTKTTFPVKQEKAQRVFDKLIADQKNKGYVASLEEARGQVTPKQEALKEEAKASAIGEADVSNTMGLSEQRTFILRQLKAHLPGAKAEPIKANPAEQKENSTQTNTTEKPKEKGLLSRIFNTVRQKMEDPTPQSRFTKNKNKTELSTSQRTQKTGGKRPLNRLIWRVGELRMQEAVPTLLAFPITTNHLDQYVLAWALGRCGDAAALPLLKTWENRPKAPDHIRSIVQEAIMALLPKEQKKEKALRILDTFPSELKNIVIEASAPGAVEDMQIPDWINKEIIKNQQAFDSIRQLYLISSEFPALRGGLLAWAQLAPMKGSGYFKSVRQLYKAAEFREDAELLGYIHKKVVTGRPNFHSKKGFAVVNNRYVRAEKVVNQPDSPLGFSQNTRDYLSRRTWRNLQRKGEAKDTSYVKMAVGVLLAFNNKDSVSPRTESFFSYRRVDGRYQSQRHIIHFTLWSPYVAFSQILFRNSENTGPSNSRSSWIYTNGQPHSEQKATMDREEAFPELWDQVPQGIMHLLAESNCTPVQAMAVKAGMANLDKLADLANTPFLVMLLDKNDSLPVNGFGAQLAERYYNSNEPDIDLAAAMLRCHLPKARTVAMQWVDERADFYFVETDFLMQLLFTTHEDVQEWLFNAFEQHPIPENKQQTLIARSVAKMLAYTAEASEEDKEAILQAGKILVNNFPEPLSSINLNLVQDLLYHNLQEVKVFGARVLVIHETPAEDIPEELIINLINGELPEMREVGVQLLGKLSDENLVEKQILLSELCNSQHPEIRKEVAIVIDRIAQNNAEFGQQIVQVIAPHLLKKESNEGRDEDLMALLMDKLKEHLPAVDTDLRLQLLNSRRSKANELGFYLLDNHTDAETLTMRQLVRLGNAEAIDIRQWVQKYYRENIPRIKYEREEAVRILDSKWDNTRDFAIGFFRENFGQEDWTPEVLVSICDSVNPLVQNFGKELITQFFQKENGEQYLLQLSQHPQANLQMFATNYLERYASDQPKNLAELEHYFTTVLSSVNKSRVAKDRIFAFLHKEGMKNKESAEIVARIIGRESATVAIGDKAQSIAIMQDLVAIYGDFGMPLKVVDFPVWEG